MCPSIYPATLGHGFCRAATCWHLQDNNRAVLCVAMDAQKFQVSRSKKVTSPASNQDCPTSCHQFVSIPIRSSAHVGEFTPLHVGVFESCDEAARCVYTLMFLASHTDLLWLLPFAGVWQSRQMRPPAAWQSTRSAATAAAAC